MGNLVPVAATKLHYPVANDTILSRGRVKMKKRVLIVDHDSAFATFLKETLESLGDYEAHIATTGEEALAKTVESHPNLVIVDMGLEDVKAEVLIQTIREIKPHLKIMVIPIGDSPLPEGLPVTGIIPKPFFVGDLPEILGKAFTSKEEPVSAPPKEPQALKFPRWVEEFLRELSPDLLAFGDTSPQFLAGGDREKAAKLFQWVARTMDENPYSRSYPAEIYYRSGNDCIYGVKMSDGMILAAAFSREVPLGMIRLVVKRREEV